MSEGDNKELKEDESNLEQSTIIENSELHQKFQELKSLSDNENDTKLIELAIEELKRNKKGIFNSPVFPTLLTVIVGLFGVVISFYNHQSSLALEKKKHELSIEREKMEQEAALINIALNASSPEEASEKLKFFIDLGLLEFELPNLNLVEKIPINVDETNIEVDTLKLKKESQ